MMMAEKSFQLTIIEWYFVGNIRQIGLTVILLTYTYTYNLYIQCTIFQPSWKHILWINSCDFGRQKGWIIFQLKGDFKATYNHTTQYFPTGNMKFCSIHIIKADSILTRCSAHWPNILWNELRNQKCKTKRR